MQAQLLQRPLPGDGPENGAYIARAGARPIAMFEFFTNHADLEAFQLRAGANDGADGGWGQATWQLHA